jgi:hypothetical protein
LSFAVEMDGIESVNFLRERYATQASTGLDLSVALCYNVANYANLAR